METRIPGATENLWDQQDAEGLSELETLAYRSNLLGRDRAVANYGGGNTSTKARERDHTGREVDVLWVKGSGSDLATIEAGQFTGLKLGEVLALEEREEMSDEEMVAYLASCQLAPDMPRGSIETLLHAFVPYAQVDHTHPDAVNMICCSEGGEELARECFGDEAVWIPYIRPGFTLSKRVGQAVRNNPNAKFVLLAKHGLVTWGETHEEVDEEMFDPNPRVVLIAGLGLVAAAKNAKEANLSRDFVYRAINVIRGAHALGGYVSLTEEESYAVEYWPLELYKLTLAPPPD